MEKSEQTKASQHVDGADRLSSFPDPVLHLILSGLPTTEEVIRTSILSRRWRYLWTSVPSIDLDYSRGPNSKPNFKRNKFKEFVYWVLLSRSLDLDSFHLTCYNLYNMSTVRRWIHAAVTRNVKQLHLMFLPGKEEKIEMPHCLVTCDSLEELKLSTSRLSLPNFTGFPSLRVLQLNGVEFFDSDLVKAFFKSCPVLEELSLIDCTIDELKVLCISCLKLKNLIIDNRVMIPEGAFSVCGNLHIACPKLVYLELIGPMAYKYSFDGLDSLKKAVIFPEYLDRASLEDELEIEHDPDPQLYINTLHEFFSGISHVESLSISISFAYECMKPEVDVAASLPNLKTLELTVDHMTKNAVKFIKYFPDLESLHLNIFSQYNPLQYWKLDDTATMRILTRQLKKVEYFDFGGRSDELEVASFFLEHGNALEEMVFKWSDKAMFNDKSNETMNEISNFHKASSTVKLIALYKYRSDGYSYDLYKYHIDSHLW